MDALSLVQYFSRYVLTMFGGEEGRGGTNGQKPNAECLYDHTTLKCHN